MIARKVKSQEPAARNPSRLRQIITDALIREAEKYPDFREKLKRALDQIVTDEKERRYLRKRGWI